MKTLRDLKPKHKITNKHVYGLKHESPILKHKNQQLKLTKT